MKSVIGYKIGMTQVFTEEGLCIPVTVVEVEPNVVLQKRSLEKDGYEALVVGMGDTRENLLTKPELGQFKKANVSAKKVVKEIKGGELMSFEVGQEVTASIFNAGDVVDVTGTTKGKGFAGVIKTYGHAIGPKGHGSGSHRTIGSFAEKSKPMVGIPWSSFCITRLARNFFRFFATNPSSTCVLPVVRSSLISSSAKSLEAMEPIANLQPVPSFL